MGGYTPTGLSVLTRALLLAVSSRGGGWLYRRSSRDLATVAGFACFGGGLLHLLVSGVGCQSRCVSRE
jgi:hypothetical protein